MKRRTKYLNELLFVQTRIYRVIYVIEQKKVRIEEKNEEKKKSKKEIIEKKRIEMT